MGAITYPPSQNCNNVLWVHECFMDLYGPSHSDTMIKVLNGFLTSSSPCQGLIYQMVVDEFPLRMRPPRVPDCTSYLLYIYIYIIIY